MPSNFDRLFISPGNPLTRPWGSQWFMTYDLHCKGYCYELGEQGFIWQIDNAAANSRRQVSIHRDLVLISSNEILVARVNAAAVEWIRTFAELGEATREFIRVPEQIDELGRSACVANR